MSHTAKTIFTFGIYELLPGPGLIIMPDPILAFFVFPESKEVWIRVTGALVSIFAFYDIEAARCELTDYFRLTVYARSSVMLFLTLFVLSGLAKPMLILFGVVDLPDAIRTALALRSSPSSE
jgi:hypothetical protein